MKDIAGFLALLVPIIIACGGGSNDSDAVLRLREYDATEQQFRTYVQLEFTPLVCNQLKDLSPEEVVNVIKASSNSQDGGSVWLDYADRNGLKEAPGQRADDASELRAAEIMLEVCGRFD